MNKKDNIIRRYVYIVNWYDISHNRTTIPRVLTFVYGGPDYLLDRARLVYFNMHEINIDDCCLAAIFASVDFKEWQVIDFYNGIDEKLATRLGLYKYWKVYNYCKDLYAPLGGR